jgi:hypothetical protein
MVFEIAKLLFLNLRDAKPIIANVKIARVEGSGDIHKLCKKIKIFFSI